MKKKRAMTDRIKCNPHPDAPHGFMRDASHSAGRYVCECESWEPPKREWVGLTVNEAREFYESDLSREDLIYKIDEFLEEKNT
ncbi:MAG: hypothetical protein EBZ61_06215 [Micrococcales bacterium]|nr:hypothetical protein [Micrococcales bacterium]